MSRNSELGISELGICVSAERHRLLCQRKRAIKILDSDSCGFAIVYFTAANSSFYDPFLFKIERLTCAHEPRPHSSIGQEKC